MRLRSLFENLTYQPGLLEAGADAQVHVLSGTHKLQHRHIAGRWPSDLVLESGYRSGPVFVFRISDAAIDLATGAVFDGAGRLIRESFGPVGLAASYAKAATLPDQMPTLESVVLPLASPRADNYSHWHMDTLAKPLIVSKSRFANEGAVPILLQAASRFQQESLSLLGNAVVPNFGYSRYVRGTAICTPGANGGGSPRISGYVNDFSDFLAERATALFGMRAPAGRSRLFISRAGAGFRRIFNEEALQGQLGKLGFHVLFPERMTMQEQITVFRNAEVIVSTHGAGLINMLYAPRSAKIVEIFPETGVHGSMYLRIAARRGMRYYAIAAPIAPNTKPQRNPKNLDMWLDLEATLDFIRETVLPEREGFVIK